MPLPLDSKKSTAHPIDQLNLFCNINTTPGVGIFLPAGNLTRDMLFEQQIRGLRVESSILAYLDLQGGEGRTKESAEHLSQ